VKADINEKGSDIIGSIFSWYEGCIAKGSFNYGTIPCINGAKIDGFCFLNKLRKESKVKPLRLIVVKNCEYKVSTSYIGSLMTMDLVKKSDSGAVSYWFEQSKGKQNYIEERVSVQGFEVHGQIWIEVDRESIELPKEKTGDDEISEDSEIKEVIDEKGESKIMMQVNVELIIPCRGNYNDMREKLLESNEVVVSGMEIDASLPDGAMRKRFILVSDWHVKDVFDPGLANLALMQIESWQELSPLTNSKGKNLFSDEVNAVLLANAFYAKRSVPAFNMLVIGPKRNQKTAAISFLTKYMMGGSIVGGSGSSGKGWLVSHKEGTEPSKMFSEKYALMIDEALKFKSDQDQSAAARLKNHFVSHMQLVEREDMEFRSGNGIVKGRMKCSLICVDNPDTSLMPAFGRAYKWQDASFRRWNFMYMDRLPNVETDYMSTHQAHEMMLEKFKDYGGVESIRSLMLASRELCANEKTNADQIWVKSFRERLMAEAGNFTLYPDFMFLRDIQDKDLRDLVIQEIREHLETDLVDVLEACWVSAAAMRGWEVCDCYLRFKLIFDVNQRELAEKMFREILRGRFTILFKGIISYLDEHRGVKRSSIF
jgi:hypothetical protein